MYLLNRLNFFKRKREQVRLSWAAVEREVRADGSVHENVQAGRILETSRLREADEHVQQESLERQSYCHAKHYEAARARERDAQLVHEAACARERDAWAAYYQPLSKRARTIAPLVDSSPVPEVAPEVVTADAGTPGPEAVQAADEVVTVVNQPEGFDAYDALLCMVDEEELSKVLLGSADKGDVGDLLPKHVETAAATVEELPKVYGPKFLPKVYGPKFLLGSADEGCVGDSLPVDVETAASLLPATVDAIADDEQVCRDTFLRAREATIQKLAGRHDERMRNECRRKDECKKIEAIEYILFCLESGALGQTDRRLSAYRVVVEECNVTCFSIPGALWPIHMTGEIWKRQWQNRAIPWSQFSYMVTGENLLVQGWSKDIYILPHFRNIIIEHLKKHSMNLHLDLFRNRDLPVGKAHHALGCTPYLDQSFTVLFKFLALMLSLNRLEFETISSS